ncbi:hypothetical protein GT516_10095 [Collinsella sp. BIOML-A4]|nr:hypothetical protein [Collinsella sp. BIOML-A2]MZJ30208.1 hypothetical protein [Collinsella sp. BIOML-A3]MZJ34034.1 hypothetical protein [Collinsella sp. BIOML-A1]MZJ97787.1 hypothetical protein [Collinsella sp. BIOML-A6]MZK31615.1 hypothetical protein [Collinsella sp. BIOML-A5]MZK67037.1 hypothetical protein [Collinsella sp. BIOML-A4]
MCSAEIGNQPTVLLFYYESFGLFAALILVQLVATGAAAFRFYYKQRKGLTEKRLNRK